MIRSLYLLKCLSLESSLFSKLALFSCCNKSLHLIKYVLYLRFAAAIPIEVAKCVLPTPLVPKNTIFSLASKKRCIAQTVIVPENNLKAVR